MAHEKIDSVVVGGGQAGLAMSAHLVERGIPHLVLERSRIAERWRTGRWDSLVMNGPAWHDRFPPKEFNDFGPDEFPSKDSVAKYLEEFAGEISSPIRCGVEVQCVTKLKTGPGFLVETSDGTIEAQNVIAATGPFQVPLIPPIIPQTDDIKQIHSHSYFNPEQLNPGSVLVIGAGSSGSQIADELKRSGRDVYLSVGPHDRPPRAYRGKDYCWWLGVLGKWEIKTPPAGREHVTISVSGANGGETVDFRRLGNRGINLLGMVRSCKNGKLSMQNDLAKNIADGDANYLSVLDEADQYIAHNQLDFPEEPEARILQTDPECLANPILELDLKEAGITNVLWATGYTQNFSWLQVETFDENGKPQHKEGISAEKGIYFLGLPWLSMRGSSFIWGVWVDAQNLARHIAGRTADKAE